MLLHIRLPSTCNYKFTNNIQTYLQGVYYKSITIINYTWIHVHVPHMPRVHVTVSNWDNLRQFMQVPHTGNTRTRLEAMFYPNITFPGNIRRIYNRPNTKNTGTYTGYYVPLHTSHISKRGIYRTYIPPYYMGFTIICKYVPFVVYDINERIHPPYMIHTYHVV